MLSRPQGVEFGMGFMCFLSLSISLNCLALKRTVAQQLTVGRHSTNNGLIKLSKNYFMLMFHCQCNIINTHNASASNALFYSSEIANEISISLEV